MAMKTLQFSDGNVEIYFSTAEEQKYILHSHVLALHSVWFKVCLSERWNTNGEATDMNGKNHWTFELRFEKGSEKGMLIRKATTGANAGTDGDETEMIDGFAKEMPKGTKKTIRTAIDLHNNRIPAIEAHQDMLAALYHVKPFCFRQPYHSRNLDSLILLAKTAEMYDCQDLIKLPIEHHLYESREKVLGSCSTISASMLELAIPLKMQWIFVQASTPLICSNKYVYEEARSSLSKLGIGALMAAKRLEFVDMLKDCDLQLLKSGRQSHVTSTSQVKFMAANYFREWVIHQLENGLGGSGLGVGYATLYRQIRSSHKSGEVPISARNDISKHFYNMGKVITISDLNKIVTEFKNVLAVADTVVAAILADNLDNRSYPFSMDRDLACVRCDEDGLPWAKK